MKNTKRSANRMVQIRVSSATKALWLRAAAVDPVLSLLPADGRLTAFCTLAGTKRAEDVLREASAKGLAP